MYKDLHVHWGSELSARSPSGIQRPGMIETLVLGTDRRVPMVSQRQGEWHSFLETDMRIAYSFLETAVQNWFLEIGRET